MSQFRASCRVWLTASFVFLVAGWLIGFCLTGILSIQQALATGLTLAEDPTPLFIMPLVFGSITLFFVLGGLIRSVIQALRAEYALWLITGATPTQIAVLVAVQLGLTGLISSLVGDLLALQTLPSLYHLLQVKIGAAMLPTVAFHFSPQGFVATGLLMTLTCFIIGLLRTKQALRRFQLTAKTAPVRGPMVRLTLAGIGLLACVGAILFAPQPHHSTQALALHFIQPLYFALICLVLLQVLGGRALLTWLLNMVTKATRWLPQGGARTAGWQVAADGERTATTLVPVLVVQTLIIGLYALLFGMADTAAISFPNVWVAFLAYIGAPLILVIANIVSVAMLKGAVQKPNLAQLSLLGFTRGQLIQERGIESGLQLIVLLLAAGLSDSSLYGLVVLACRKAGIANNMQLATTAGVSLVIAGTTALVLWLIDVVVILRQ
ncbi:ABC transporter permease family protein [Lacticaseibacillus daqingensis]|uniref:hypothetical protein n=1 Tax=Lacticaseibacillus daqingensis TaxID=2486014 RepID=UPI0013DE1CC0|nr:hypothetical protein [Lacticaseibacillus daqingensis]